MMAKFFKKSVPFIFLFIYLKHTLQCTFGTEACYSRVHKKQTNKKKTIMMITHLHLRIFQSGKDNCNTDYFSQENTIVTQI